MSEGPCTEKDFCLRFLSSAWQPARSKPTRPQHAAVMPPTKERRRLKSKRRLAHNPTTPYWLGQETLQLRRFSRSAGHRQVDRQNSGYGFRRWRSCLSRWVRPAICQLLRSHLGTLQGTHSPGARKPRILGRRGRVGVRPVFWNGCGRSQDSLLQLQSRCVAYYRFE